MNVKINRIKNLVITLNEHRDNYYNKQNPTISDYEYDLLFDELTNLENETGFIISNSPTQTVGYEVKSEQKKVKHSHPMLSLDKTKSVEDLKKFVGNKDCIFSLKMDGLTILLTYEDGKLIKAETRGNGDVGEDITHNAKVFENIPLQIDYKGHLEIEGEAIITYDDFEKINNLIENPDDRYKNPRNLVSGSVRQLDSSIAAKRHIKFIAWKVPTEKKYMLNGLIDVKELGFEIVPFIAYFSGDNKNIDRIIEALKNEAKKRGYPIDGLVMSYNDIAYGESLGCTGHHPKHSIAFKFYDEVYETELLDIEWTMGKSGVLTPTAVFETVEIDGTEVSRAYVHNISILTNLDLHIGDTIEVYKANMIIPQVKRNISSENRKEYDYIKIPSHCPICGGVTEIKQDNDSKVLVCTNENCKGKLLGKLNHFVSKNAMNIEGLSEATLERFISLGWVESFMDIYELKDRFGYDIANLDGFGKKSVDKLFDAIETSKNTTLDKFIYSLSIPLIGRSASKTIAKYFNYDFDEFVDEAMNPFKWFNWKLLEDFGDAMHDEMWMYLTNNRDMISELAKYLTFEKPQTSSNSNSLKDKVFVITGSLNHFANRDEAKEKIELLGGKVTGSVSAKTNYLVNNDITSTSGKNRKAKDLNIPIISEEELIEMLK